MGAGQVVIIGEGLPPDPPPPDREIRATFLRALILGRIADCPVPETGVRVRGAHIEGDGPEGAETRGLTLESCDLAQDLGLYACRLPDRLLLRSASLRNLYLVGSHLHEGLFADGLKARGGLILREVFVQGMVGLIGAKLEGVLECDRARLDSGDMGMAVAGDRLEVHGEVFLREIAVQGEVRLRGAILGGGLECGGAHLIAGRTGNALSLETIKVKGRVFLGASGESAAPNARPFVAEGEVRLIGAKLGESLDVTGGQLSGEQTGRTLVADRLETGGGVFLRKAVAKGTVQLPGAKIGGVLDCDAARLTAGPSGEALFADGIEVRDGVFLRGVGESNSSNFQPFLAEGEIRLMNAKVAQSLSCVGARLTAGKTERALNLQGARISGTFFLRGGAKFLAGRRQGQRRNVPQRGGNWEDQRRGNLFAGRGPTRAGWMSLRRIHWPSTGGRCGAHSMAVVAE